MCIYTDAFKASDSTDAVLVVDGNKLHVNKALLSYHSDFFKTLFNSDFKEKAQAEIEIQDVNFEQFATLLSFVHPNPIKANVSDAEKLLELAERFLLPAAKLHMDVFLSAFADEEKKVFIGEKFGLMDLVDNGLKVYTSYYKRWEFDYQIRKSEKFANLSNSSKVYILTRFLELKGY